MTSAMLMYSTFTTRVVTVMMAVDDVFDRLITYLADQLLNLTKIPRKFVIDQNYPVPGNAYSDVSSATDDGVEPILDSFYGQAVLCVSAD